MKKIKELKRVDGRFDGGAYRTIDQLLGETINTKFPTLVLAEYEKYLSDLPKIDLFNHAQKVGLIPVDNRPVLTSRLIKEFNRYVASTQTPPKLQKTKPLSNEALRILAEGR